MTAGSPYYRPAGTPTGPPPRRYPWLPIAVGVAFVAAAAVLLAILLDPSAFGLGSPGTAYRTGPFGGAFLVFFVLIVGFFIVRVLFWSTRASRYQGGYGSGRGRGYGGNRPAMVARMRYARGEITREQYNQIMQDLGRPPGAP
jgi:uncharacterized membrane protein